MIQEEPVAWAFDVAKASQRAIQAIAKPVDHKAEAGQPEEDRVVIRQVVADRDQHCAQETDPGKDIRGHPARHVLCQPLQRGALQRPKQNAVDPAVLLHAVLFFNL